jgi:hypothetical protein
MDEELTAQRIAEITAYVDIEASPPDYPTAHVVFGTNQLRPAAIAAERYHRGLAPLIILTGGVNRLDGSIEAREFHRVLAERDVPDSAIRIEDRSATTQQNVERGAHGWRLASRSVSQPADGKLQPMGSACAAVPRLARARCASRQAVGIDAAAAEGVHRLPPAGQVEDLQVAELQR